MSRNFSFKGCYTFTQNAAGTAGAFGRHVLDGPGVRNVDVGAFRRSF